jgi:hypothetical protein
MNMPGSSTKCLVGLTASLGLAALLAPAVDASAQDSSAQSTTAQSAPPSSAPAGSRAPRKSSAQIEAGEPRADASPAADAASGPGAASAVTSAASAATAGSEAGGTAEAPGKSRTPPAPRAGKPAVQKADRVDLGTATVTGDREQPKVMYVVPWKKSDIGDQSGRPMNSLLDEALAPIDRDEFKREVAYYDAVKVDSPQNGAPNTTQGEK